MPTTKTVELIIFIEGKGQILNLGDIHPGTECLILEDFNGKTTH